MPTTQFLHWQGPCQEQTGYFAHLGTMYYHSTMHQRWSFHYILRLALEKIIITANHYWDSTMAILYNTCNFLLHQLMQWLSTAVKASPSDEWQLISHTLSSHTDSYIQLCQKFNIIHMQWSAYTLVNLLLLMLPLMNSYFRLYLYYFFLNYLLVLFMSCGRGVASLVILYGNHHQYHWSLELWFSTSSTVCSSRLPILAS